MEFTAEELFDEVDRFVNQLLARHGLEGPPVDALRIVQDEFNYTLREIEDDDEERSGRFGPRAPRRRGREILFRIDHSDEARNILSARACAKEMIPRILAKLGVAEGTDNKSARTSLTSLISARLLLPTRWFERDARQTGFDLLQLKQQYSTATYDAIALRMLETEEPCIIAVVDDGHIATRKGNREQASRKLSEPELLCLSQVEEAGEPQTVRRDAWTVTGWPIPDGPFNRIILRAAPDEV